jgi:hypothetical protein
MEGNCTTKRRRRLRRTLTRDPSRPLGSENCSSQGRRCVSKSQMQCVLKRFTDNSSNHQKCKPLDQVFCSSFPTHLLALAAGTTVMLG